MTERIDVAVIGAGVVGLAVARALAGAGREVVVLEATGAIGSATSSRNSEVIHAGIYYPTGTLKARLCVEGRDLLYAYCAERRIAHRRLTKLLVAVDDREIAALEALRRQARANGAGDLNPLSGADARRLEPALRCVAALESPLTGIIDSHAYMLALRGDAEARGAALAFHAPVTGGRATGDGVEITVGGATPTAVHCRLAVNCAGLAAQSVAAAISGFPPDRVPPLHLAKGNYFAPAGVGRVFDRLIYPMPDVGGLGIHVTLDLAGQMRFGPDVEWIDRIDYHVDPSRVSRFYPAIRRYWPDLPDGCLQPAYSGIRPKLSEPGDPAHPDFVVQGPRDHGIAGLINLFGIESPGLTASLALARYVSIELGASTSNGL